MCGVPALQSVVINKCLVAYPDSNPNPLLPAKLSSFLPVRIALFAVQQWPCPSGFSLHTLRFQACALQDSTWQRWLSLGYLHKRPALFYSRISALAALHILDAALFS